MRRPAKILFLSSCVRGGGAGWSLYYLLKHLDRSRIEPIVVVPERGIFDRRFDALSARIRYERADRQDRFGSDRYAWDWRDRFGNWWSVNARQRELNRRIEVGIRRGELTRAEAARLRQRYYAIAQLERRYRRSGGGLSYAERRDLDRRFAYLAQAIRWERNDWQERA